MSAGNLAPLTVMFAISWNCKVSLPEFGSYGEVYGHFKTPLRFCPDLLLTQKLGAIRFYLTAFGTGYFEKFWMAVSLQSVQLVSLWIFHC